MFEIIGAILILWAIVLALWNKGNWFLPYMLALGILSIVMGMILPAKAQHVHPDETITDPRVAKFYDEWKRPPSRVVSCCSSKDCYAAPIRPGPKGGVEYFHKWTQTWAAIPQSVLEHNQTDALDSPNHEAHVCASPYAPDLVYCAVLGGGT